VNKVYSLGKTSEGVAMLTRNEVCILYLNDFIVSIMIASFIGLLIESSPHIKAFLGNVPAWLVYGLVFLGLWSGLSVQRFRYRKRLKSLGLAKE